MNKQEKYDWKVCVRCFTYNHAPYIVDAMNGFTMQETNFPFVCAIVDDASTDGEQEVIKHYLNEHFDLEDKKVTRYVETDDYILTFARHKTNLNCYFAVFYLKYNHYVTIQLKARKLEYISEWRDNAKYIALCEGDDYWITSDKLQKQVDYLEFNSSCSLIHTRFNFLYVKTDEMYSDSISFKNNTFITNHQRRRLAYNILNSNKYRIQTVTAMYRCSSYNKIKHYKEDEFGLFLMGDTQLWLNLLTVGDIYMMSDVTSVYRINRNSACRSDDILKQLRFSLSAEEMRYYYSRKLNINKLYFYLRYLKALFHYKIIDREYNTNTHILGGFAKWNNRFLSVVLFNKFILYFINLFYRK